jgi:hypothetical protein
VHSKLDSLKNKELGDKTKFEEANPEVNLPGALDVGAMVEGFPPLTISEGSPLREATVVNS